MNNIVDNVVAVISLIGIAVLCFICGMGYQKTTYAPDVTPAIKRCICGCEKTGKCTCPNCSVGCGFVVPAETK